MMKRTVNNRCEQEEPRCGDWALCYLDGLPVLLEDVDPHHRFVELWIQGLDDFIVQMLLHNKRKHECTTERNARRLNAPPKGIR